MQSKELSYDILSCFGHEQNHFEMERNTSLSRQKNNHEIIISHKGTRMVKDGEDKHGLQMINVKNLA